MCGILGYFSKSVSANLDFEFKKSLRELSHRGPDAEGIEEFTLRTGKLLFGHRRLSILDLSHQAGQPMISQNGRYTLIFNGEIYNYIEIRNELQSLGYTFTSTSDTEVLLYSLQEWDTKVLEKLSGMFAFGLFDKEENRLLIARDAFGIKPLFFCCKKTKFIFGSELKNIADLGFANKQINNESLFSYLYRGKTDITSDTHIEGINTVLPGHYIEIDLNQIEEQEITQQKWWYPSICENINITFNEAKNNLRDLFIESVKMHLRSDVLVGATLSGGLDSSAIVCTISILSQLFQFIPSAI